MRIALALLIAALAGCAKSEQKTDNGSNTTTSGYSIDSTGTGLKVAYVNIDTLVSGYEYHKGLRAQLETQLKALETELGRKGQVLQENYQVLEQQASRLSEAELRQAQQELMIKQQQAMEYRDAQTQKLAAEEEKLTALLKDDMKAVIDSMRVAKKLDFILSYGEGGPILSAEPGLDITQEVLDQLNAANKARRAK